MDAGVACAVPRVTIYRPDGRPRNIPTPAWLLDGLAEGGDFDDLQARQLRLMGFRSCPYAWLRTADPRAEVLPAELDDDVWLVADGMLTSVAVRIILPTGARGWEFWSPDGELLALSMTVDEWGWEAGSGRAVA